MNKVLTRYSGVLTLLFVVSTSLHAQKPNKLKPLIIEQQGSFAVGATTITEPETASLEQFFRQMTPNTGSFDAGIISDAVSQLFDKIGV